MNWTMPYPWRARSDSVRRINMSSEPGNESFFCALRPIPRILSLRRRDYLSQVHIGEALVPQNDLRAYPRRTGTWAYSSKYVVPCAKGRPMNASKLGASSGTYRLRGSHEP